MRIIFIAFVLLSGNVFGQNVGIGTSSPLDKLTISTGNGYGISHLSSVTAQGFSTYIDNNGVFAGSRYSAPFHLYVGTNGANLTVASSGNVGVGTVTPGSWRLLAGTGVNSFGFGHSDGTHTLGSYVGGADNGGYFGTTSDHPLHFFAANSSARVTLSTAGNLGIGTTNPATKLHVQGDGDAVRVSGNQSYISFRNNTGDYKGYLWNKSNTDIELGTPGENTNGRVLLSVRGIEALRVHSDARIGVGGVPDAFGSGFTVNNGLSITNPLTTSWVLKSGFADGYSLDFYLGNFPTAYLDTSGDLYSFSDARLKENFAPYKSVLEGVKQLKISTYDYKGQGSKNNFGLIAQNVKSFFPELVKQSDDKNQTLAISYNKTGVLALKAIQEQQEIIENLQQQISRLEKLVNELAKKK